jgi:hypothetical protein
VPINVTCPGCESVMTVPDAAAGRFGTCRKCDTRLRVPASDAAPEIAFDDAPPVESQPRSTLTSTPARAKAAVAMPLPKTLKQQYSEVQFYRRNGLVSLLVLLGFAGMMLIPPLGICLVIASVIAATGDVYNYSLGDDGKLQKWGLANRVVGILMFVAWIIRIALYMHG